MPEASEVGNAGIQKLDEAAKEHEKEIVIDLGSDRFIKWIGVYLFLALAVVVKIAEAVENNIICFPANSSDFDEQILSYASTFCWEVSQENVSSSCSSLGPKYPRLLREFIQWFPYALLFQAFVFAMPWAYWHFRFGARLLGHLKFMQLLLDSIFNNLRTLEEKVIYKGKPYDERSRQFDGSRLYDPKGQNKDEEPGCFSNLLKSCCASKDSKGSLTTVAVANETEKLPLQKQNDKKVISTTGHGAVPSSSGARNKNKLKLSCFEKLIVGQMRDRHLFSIFCYENFAHLPHLPYILSVFKLTESSSEETKLKRGYYYLDQAMLYLWSDDKNLQNILLIKKYLLKHIVTALMALVMVGLMITLAIFVYDDIVTADTFPCQLTYKSICMLCSFRGKRDLFALFLIDLIFTFFLFCASIWHWLRVRNSSGLSNSHYFDELKSTSNIALLQVYKAKKKEKKEQ